MGIDANSLIFLLSAKKSGVLFENTMMIGRQQIVMTSLEFKALLSRFQFHCDDETAQRILNDNNGFAERLFQFLGAENVLSLDLSSYENATHIHDMNFPIPENFHGPYSLVFDGGSLEHIFNFPTAMQNCMEMVSEGGHFIGITPANNLMGHGFYQFSPDLFYSIFSSSNGFKIERMYIAECVFGAPFFRVTRPAVTKNRIELRNNRQTYLFVQARRECVVPIFKHTPLQNFYSQLWKVRAGQASGSVFRPTGKISGFLLNVRSRVPPRLKNLLLALRDFLNPPLSKKRHFEKVRF